MKIKSYKVLFHFFSFLSDKTNGASLFVRYKILIGTIIIGLTTTSCNRSKNTITCYDMAVPDTDSLFISDQDTILRQNQETTNNDTLVTIKVPIPEIPEELLVTCYDMAIIEEEVFTYGTTEISPISAEGDINSFLSWVLKNIQYPEKMIKNNEQGRVMVSFIIDTEGNLTNIEILRSFSEEANKEVIRILSSSPKWTPGENKGEKVKTKITIPITFKLS